MDFAAVKPVIERCALVYLQRCDDPKVEAAYDRVLAVLTSPPPASDPENWTPPPEWCRQVHAVASAFNLRFGCNA